MKNKKQTKREKDNEWYDNRFSRNLLTFKINFKKRENRNPTKNEIRFFLTGKN